MITLETLPSFRPISVGFSSLTLVNNKVRSTPSMIYVSTVNVGTVRIKPIPTKVLV